MKTLFGKFNEFRSEISGNYKISRKCATKHNKTSSFKKIQNIWNIQQIQKIQNFKKF